MKREEYLNYVRVRFDRMSSEGMLAGITSWGLLIAIVYLMWNSIPAFSEIRNKQDIVNTSLLLYAYIQLTIIFSHALFFHSGNFQTASRFNVRIYRNETTGFLALTLFLYLSIGQPLLIFILFDETLSESRQWGLLQYKINIYFLSFIFFAGFCNEIYEFYYKRKTGYPSPLVLVSQSKISSTWGRVFWTVFSAELALGNLYSVYLTSRNIPDNLFSSVSIFSLNMALIFLSIILLLRTTLTRRGMNRVLQIERDILFHELNESEIKSRIQDDIIGYEVGDWLQEKIIEVRNKASDLIHHAERASGFCTEYQSLDKSLKHERKWRLKEYLGDLKAAQENYIRKSEALHDWLSSVVRRGFHIYDLRVTAVIDRTVGELETISKDVESKVIDAVEKLETLR